MTTDQTIDGEPRRVCHACVTYPRDAYCPVCDPTAQGELCALLDAPAVESELSRMTRRCQNAELALKVQTENYEVLKAAQPQDNIETLRDKCGVQMVDCPECSHQWDHFFECGNKPAAQHQGDPVAWMQPNQAGMCISSEVKLHSLKIGGAPAAAVAGYSVPLYAEQPEPIAAVPDGYCIMPRQLTAENGAKALLLGEFKLLVTEECPECCDLEEPAEGCSICDGEGEYGQKHTIPWDQIKFIYSKAVSGLAVKAVSAKTR